MITFVTLNDLDIFIKLEKTLNELVSYSNESTVAYRDLAPVIQEFSKLVEYNQKLMTRLEKSIKKMEELERGIY